MVVQLTSMLQLCTLMLSHILHACNAFYAMQQSLFQAHVNTGKCICDLVPIEHIQRQQQNTSELSG